MSAELSKARQQLSQIRANLKQGKIVPAVQAVQFAISAMLKNSLLRPEREEFERLIKDAVDYIGNEESVRKSYPLQLEYVPGMERVLYDVIKDLGEELSRGVVEEAQAQLQAREQKKKMWLTRGIEELRTVPTKGQATLAALVREYPDDAELKGLVGEALLNAQLYEPAVEYLTVALDMKPDMLPFYNVIGMALRKLQRYEAAEGYYLRASKYLRHDPNLYFNIGRLYVDWRKWPKAIAAAQMALRLNPEFVEAQKLLRYSEAELAKIKK